MPFEYLIPMAGLVSAVIILTYRVGWLHGKAEK